MKEKPLKIEDFTCHIVAKRYQMRFWTSKASRDKFKKACADCGIPMQSVLNQFLDWFSEQAS